MIIAHCIPSHEILIEIIRISDDISLHALIVHQVNLQSEFLLLLGIGFNLFISLLLFLFMFLSDYS